MHAPFLRRHRRSFMKETASAEDQVRRFHVAGWFVQFKKAEPKQTTLL
jgi:hypothetical protein